MEQHMSDSSYEEKIEFQTSKLQAVMKHQYTFQVQSGTAKYLLGHEYSLIVASHSY